MRVLTLLTLFLVGCTPVRPIVKIGLLAPFEGLYRDSGYAALAGMRAALAACALPGVDVLPLAMDDGGAPDQARRSAEKLLADPAVVAVVGPLLYPLLPAAGDVIGPAGVPWVVPPTVQPNGEFAAPADPTWLTDQVEFVRTSTAAARVLVIGLPPALLPGWEPPAATVRVDDPGAALAALRDGDAVIWLGLPDAGAAWYDRAQSAHPELPFWLSLQAGSDVAVKQMRAAAPVRWVDWAENGYTEGPQQQTPRSPISELTYQATCEALTAVADASSRPARP